MKYLQHKTGIFRRLLRIRLLVLFLLCGFGLTGAVAQNNVYKIDDELYTEWLHIYRTISANDTPQRIDALLKKCDLKGDVKAHCMVYSLRAIYYQRKGNLRMQIANLEECKDYVLKTPYKQYIFDCWNRLINYYINNRMPMKAYEEMRAYQDMAFQTDDAYGISNGYRKIGDFYSLYDDDSLRLEQYRKAAEVMVERHLDSELQGLYYQMADCCLTNEQTDEALMYARLSLEAYKHSGRDPMRSYIMMALVLMDQDPVQRDSVDYYVNSMCEEAKKGITLLPLQGRYKLALTQYKALQGKYKEAMEYYSRDKHPNAYHTVARLVGRWSGNDSLYYAAQKYLLNASNKRMINSNRRVAMDYMLRNDELQLEHDNRQMALQNAQLQLQQTEAREKLLAMAQERGVLAMKQKELELEKQVTEKERFLAEAQRAKEEVRATRQQQMHQAERTKQLQRLGELDSKRLQVVMLVVLVILLFMMLMSLRNFLQNQRLKREKQFTVKAQQQAEEERKLALEAQKQAEEADHMKGVFLQEISHEIRTPLNAIVGFNEVVNGEMGVDFTKEERKEFLELIHTNADQLTVLVNDVLDLSKLESGTYQLRPEPVALGDFCHQLIEEIRPEVPEGVALQLEISHELEAMTIETDRMGVHRILTHYLDNACKFTEQGSITLTVDHRVDHRDRSLDPASRIKGPVPAIRFAVTDTGCGIPEDAMERIFNRFEKLDVFKKGYGLGLNICRHLALLLGGEVYVDTTYKKGARMVFVLPLC